MIQEFLPAMPRPLGDANAGVPLPEEPEEPQEISAPERGDQVTADWLWTAYVFIYLPQRLIDHGPRHARVAFASRL